VNGSSFAATRSNRAVRKTTDAPTHKPNCEREIDEGQTSDQNKIPANRYTSVPYEKEGTEYELHPSAWFRKTLRWHGPSFPFCCLGGGRAKDRKTNHSTLVTIGEFPPLPVKRPSRGWRKNPTPTARRSSHKNNTQCARLAAHVGRKRRHPRKRPIDDRG